MGMEMGTGMKLSGKDGNGKEIMGMGGNGK